MEEFVSKFYAKKADVRPTMLFVKMTKFFRKELNIGCLQETFWSESKVVLGYIRNTTKKFKILAAHSFQQIHENSEVNQWKYVPIKDNTADHASCTLIDVNSGWTCSTYVNGPQFLWEPERTWPVEKKVQMVSDTDFEVKYSLKVNLTSLMHWEKHFHWKRSKG